MLIFFLQQVIENERYERYDEENKNYMDILDYESLNEIIFIWKITLSKHMNLQVIIMETAGTGKLYLIKVIQKKLYERNKTPLLLVLVSTGVAAIKVRGR